MAMASTAKQISPLIMKTVDYATSCKRMPKISSFFAIPQNTLCRQDKCQTPVEKVLVFNKYWYIFTFLTEVRL